MAHTPTILGWIKKYDIKSILNAPGGSRGDEESLKEAGATMVLSIDIGGGSPMTEDLCFWRPPEPYDALYTNCFYCTSNSSQTGNHETAAKNMASWPVKYIIIYDTKGFDWGPYFLESGWEILEREPQDFGTVLEIWGRAA